MTDVRTDNSTRERDPGARLGAARSYLAEHDLYMGPIGHLAEERERLAGLKFRHFDVAPMSATNGAEMSGVDLTANLDDDVIDEVYQALLAYKAIFFRDQPLTPAQHVAFARRFGDDSGSNILVSLLIPFAAYLVAEHVESSGVLAAAAAGIPLTTNQVGGMFGIFFSEKKVRTYAEAMDCDVDAFRNFFHSMLDEGIYLAPSAFEAGFVSAAHTATDIEATGAAARRALTR